jgi:hypothetical protein
VELGRVDIPPISRISGAWGDERMEEIEDNADCVLTWEGVPSEKESGVALNIAIIIGVSFNGSGVVVGMIGTNDWGCRARRTEIGSLRIGCTNVGEILFIS